MKTNRRNCSTHQKSSVHTAELKEEITNVKDNLNQVKTEIQLLGQDVLDPYYVTNKLIELEDHSRCNNIRIDGIEEE